MAWHAKMIPASMAKFWREPGYVIRSRTAIIRFLDLDDEDE
jgi:hypothetical protein